MDENKPWRQIIDNKYGTHNPNIFYCPSNNVSPICKGIMWACNAAKLGYQCNVGNGKSVKFWEDCWLDLGGTSLAIFIDQTCLFSAEQETDYHLF